MLAETAQTDVGTVAIDNNSMMMSVGDFEEMIELTPVEERKTRKRKFDETRSKPKNKLHC